MKSVIGFHVGLWLFTFAFITAACATTEISMSEPSSESATQASNEWTRSAERTAIAIFTQNPTLALSSTPYYAEIIFNELARQTRYSPNMLNYDYESVTLTADSFAEQAVATMTYFVLNATTSPTPDLTSLAASPTATTSYICSPTVDTLILNELSSQVNESFAQIGLDSMGSIVTTGVSAIDGTCTSPFEAVYTYFRFGVEVESVTDLNTLTQTTESIIDTLTSLDPFRVENVSQISSFLIVDFFTGEQHIYIQTYLNNALNAYRDGLRGEDLLEALGGLVDEN